VGEGQKGAMACHHLPGPLPCAPAVHGRAGLEREARGRGPGHRRAGEAPGVVDPACRPACACRGAPGANDAGVLCRAVPCLLIDAVEDSRAPTQARSLCAASLRTGFPCAEGPGHPSLRSLARAIMLPSQTISPSLPSPTHPLRHTPARRWRRGWRWPAPTWTCGAPRCAAAPCSSPEPYPPCGERLLALARGFWLCSTREWGGCGGVD
jgi:hypothetical protein